MPTLDIDKNTNEIFTELFKIKQIYAQKHIPANIYYFEQEMGIEWKRGDHYFSVSVDIIAKTGYIQEYTSSREIFVEDYRDLKRLMKRTHQLIKKHRI